MGSVAVLAVVGCGSSASFPRPFEQQPEGTVCFDETVASRLQDGGCAVAGDSLRLRFKSQMSSSFVLRRVMLSFDDEVVVDVTDEALLRAGTFVGTIRQLEPGEHVIQSRLFLQGEGAGVFSYLRGYRFEVKNEVRVRVRPGPSSVAGGDRPPVLAIVASDAGDPRTPLEQRPRLRSELEPPSP